MRTELLRFNGAVERAPAIDAWMREHAGELGAIAHHWFGVMRKCGDEVRELLHDGCPVACLGEMRPSATTSMSSLRTLTWVSFTAQRCPIRPACCKAPASSCAM